MREFKTQDELLEHYWSVIVPMCRQYNAEHGTDVKPWGCVRHLNGVFGATDIYNKLEYKDHPDFRLLKNKSGYEFAVAILESEPVFVGDRLWNTLTNAFVTVTNGSRGVKDMIYTNGAGMYVSHFAWTPPTDKRTFRLNGVELPCPVKKLTESNGHTVCVDGHVFFFLLKNEYERDILSKEIIKLLTEARDKE